MGKNRKELCDCVIDYILNCPLDKLNNLTVDNITKKFKVSKMHLIRSFKICRKITPGKFIVREKMIRALLLMQRNGNLTVYQTAEILGFSTTDYFIRVFKDHFGKPPCQYLDCQAKQDREYSNR